MAQHFTLPAGLVALVLSLLTPAGAGAAMLDPGAIRDFGATDFPNLTTPVRIANLTGSAGQVMLDLSTGPVTGAVTPGFKLLDRTLTASFTGLGKGEIRARYGIRIDGRRLRRLGIRASQLRLMQFDVRAGRWVRARRALRRDQVRVRFLRASPTFGLGDFGVDPKNNLVWGVTNTGGAFAVAARLAQAPAPATLLLAGVGFGALGAVAFLRRRRRG